MKRALLFVLLIITNMAFSQNVDFTKKNFPNDPKGLKKALDSIKAGDKYYVMAPEWRFNAIPYYLSANKFNPNNALLNYKIGYCYLTKYSAFKTRAIPYLEAAFKLNQSVAPNIHYLLGEAYQLNMDWDRATQEYNAYMQSLDSKTNAKQIADAKRKIDECKNGALLVKNPVSVFIDNLGPNINTQYPEYGPLISADETTLMFTSRRPSAKGKLADDAGLYYENIYMANYRNGQWLPATNIGEPVNHAGEHVATAGLSPDGKILYIYKNENNGDLYQTFLEGGEWTKPQKIGGKINTKYRETSLSLAGDNKTLYLVSDRPGGFGGKDIYKVTLNDKAKWTEPVNLGPTINTQYDEEGADIQADGKTLFFSSKGHNTMGGFDIFKSTYDSGKWSEPVNLGYPVNTPDDDVFISVSKNGKHGYYSSARTDGKGETDIYKVTFLGPEKPVVVSSEDATLAGGNADVGIDNALNFAGKLLCSDESAKPLPDIIIGLVDTAGIVIDSAETNEFGSFLFHNVTPDKRYDFAVFIKPGNIPSCPKIKITDRDGNLIKEIQLNGQGKYKFTVLAADTLEIKHLTANDSQLRFRLKAGLVDENSKPISAVRVKMADNAGKVLFAVTTDSSGIFTFTNLPLDRAYMVEIDTTDSHLTAFHRVFLTDSKGNVIRELKFGKDYKFNVLPADYNKMGDVEVYDPWLAALNMKNNKKENNLSIIENIYFDYQKSDILPAAETVLNKVIQVMQASPDLKIELDAYTDSRGNDAVNLKLSQKRADAAVAYMVQHGVSKGRVTGKGFGKAHPLNKCGDPKVHCTEEEYAVNRRIEFKISKITSKDK